MKTPKKIHYFKLALGTLLSVFFFLPQISFAAGASMFLSSSCGVYSQKKDLVTRILINSGGEMGINAAESKIIFNPGQLQVKKITKEGSLFDLWAQAPKFDNKKGIITFTGGTTKPFKGTSGVVLKIYFTPKKAGSFDVKIDPKNSSILAADGFAANILKETANGNYIIGNASAVAGADALRAKMAGKFLIQPGKTDQFWFVNPADRLRYLIDSSKATNSLSMLRKLAIKAKPETIKKGLAGTFAKVNAGSILINTANQKIYFIDVKSYKGVPLEKPADLTALILKQKTKIGAGDLKKIPDWTI
jgi:hypothetical protein